MASPVSSIPVPSAPVPTQPDDDDDNNNNNNGGNDDDDDDQTPAPPAPTPGPTNPPPPAQPAPTTLATTASPPPPGTNSAGTLPSSPVTSLADSRPSGDAQNPVAPGNDTLVAGNEPTNGDDGLSSGATAGIAVGVVLAVLLMLLAAWFFIRRKRSRARQVKAALASTARAHTPDEESAKKAEIYAYRTQDPAELGGDPAMGHDPRRPSELASPVVPVEVTGDRQFAAELQGSEVPKRTEER